MTYGGNGDEKVLISDVFEIECLSFDIHQLCHSLHKEPTQIVKFQLTS